jgi:hypothetical protein
MKFCDRPETKKGDLGEAEVDQWIHRQGYVPYRPDFNGPHPFDRLCATPDRRKLLIVESKCKPRRRYYPDTGFNCRHYRQYRYILETHAIDTFVAFVDEDSGTIYGNLLTVLDLPRIIKHNEIYLPSGELTFDELHYPREQHGIRYYPLIAMQTVAPIAAATLAQMRALSRRNPAYAPSPDRPVARFQTDKDLRWD